jgi:HEAT repeat protein/CHAT domain-containing protein
MAKILFLDAKSSDERSMMREIRTIDEKIRLSDFRDLFEIVTCLATRVTDLQGYLLRHKPEIVHFVGNANASSGLIFENNHGEDQRVTVEALSQLFALLKDNIFCVALNASNTKRQAQAIAEHIECTIGMSKPVTDQAAISFFASFYQALGYGKSIKNAFDLGCNQIKMDNLKGADIPKLIALNPKSVDRVIVQRRLSDASSLEILAKLGQGGSERRGEAARQLGYLKEPVAIPILERQWLLEPDPTVRYWLAIALGEIGGREAACALLRLRTDEQDLFALLGIEEALKQQGEHSCR